MAVKTEREREKLRTVLRLYVAAFFIEYSLRSILSLFYALLIPLCSVRFLLYIADHLLYEACGLISIMIVYRRRNFNSE